MKKKVSELSGAELYYAVALADGHKAEFSLEDCPWGKKCFRKADSGFDLDSFPYSPGTDWELCGEIIEKMLVRNGEVRIGDIYCIYNDWHNEKIYKAKGINILEAICCCFVASKLGDEIEIPKC